MLVKTLNHEKSAVDCEADEPVFHSSGRVGRKSWEKAELVALAQTISVMCNI